MFNEDAEPQGHAEGPTQPPARAIGGPGAFRAANPDLSLDELTDRYLREASAQDLRVIVRDAFRNLERSHTRAIESSVSEDLRRLMSQPVPRQRPVTDEQREFIARLAAQPHRFGGEAKRAEATAAQQHRERLALEKIHAAQIHALGESATQ